GHPAQSIEPAVATRLRLGSRRSDELLIDDRLAEIDALVADGDAIRARDQLPDLVLRLPAEGAAVVGHSAHLQRTSMFSRWNARRASQKTARSSTIRTIVISRNAPLSSTTRPVTCAMPRPTTGTTTRPPICCATRTSFTRVEIRMPR